MERRLRRFVGGGVETGSDDSGDVLRRERVPFPDGA